MSTLNKGEIIRCPNCTDPQEGVVEEYVVPGWAGQESARVHDCVNCDAEFYVEFDGTVYYVELI